MIELAWAFKVLHLTILYQPLDLRNPGGPDVTLWLIRQICAVGKAMGTSFQKGAYHDRILGISVCPSASTEWRLGQVRLVCLVISLSDLFFFLRAVLKINAQVVFSL